MKIKELKEFLNTIEVDENIEIYRIDNSGTKEEVYTVSIGDSDLGKIIMLFH